MDEHDRAPGTGARPRPRKPTPASVASSGRRSTIPTEILEAAARFLEARPRSVAEVRRRLTRPATSRSSSTGTVDRLRELGYLDDDTFARAWVESRDRAQTAGEHALRRELQLKGVDRALIDVVLDDRREHAAAAAGQDDQPASPDDVAAERLLRKKLPAILRETDPRKRRQRAYALLARNGFAPDVCSAVSKRMLDADAAAGDDG